MSNHPTLGMNAHEELMKCIDECEKAFRTSLDHIKNVAEKRDYHHIQYSLTQLMKKIQAMFDKADQANVEGIMKKDGV